MATGATNGNSAVFEAAWKEAVKTIALKRLHGLRSVCPRCGMSGTVTSKWVRGVAVKPLYICHHNGNGRFKQCRLNSTQAATARTDVRLTRDDAVKMLRMGKCFVLFSGGRDSLCLLHYMNLLAKRTNKELTALHVDTTAGFPEVEQYVQDVCSFLGVPLVTVRPEYDYFEIAKRWGIPGVKSRWCCKTLKIAPIRRFLKKQEDPKLVFDGIRAAESNLRATYIPVWYHPAFRCISVSPIFSWTDERVGRYISDNKLPKSPAADLNTSAECWCGAYKSRSDFEELLKLHPDIFDKLIEVEEAQRGKYTFLFEEGKRVRLRSLRKRKGD